MVKPEEIVVFKLKSWAVQTDLGPLLAGDAWFRDAEDEVLALRGTSVKIIVADFKGVISCCYVAAKCLFRLKSRIGEYLPKAVLVLTNRTADVQDAIQAASTAERAWVALDSSPFFQGPGHPSLVPIAVLVHAAGANGITAADLTSLIRQNRKDASTFLLHLESHGVLLRRVEQLQNSGGRQFRYWTPANFLRLS